MLKTPVRLLACILCSLLPIAIAGLARAQEGQLSNEAIFRDDLFEADKPGATQWLSEENAYTVLEPAASAQGSDAAEAEDGEDEESGEKGAEGEGGEEAEAQDIVAYDLDTLERRVLVTAAQLTPEGADAPLSVDDYRWSEDRKRLLIYTNSEQVWRVKSRGDYWVLDLPSGALRQLGGPDAQPSSLQFAKFSPDGVSVAYVRDADLYVESFDGEITRLTQRDGEHVINGIMSWAYEEEFGIRDGFRWSPDGQRIAYWQFDTSGVRDFLLIDNTSELYPTITRIPYPKVGETISAARIGIVAKDGGDTVWAQTPGDPRQNYLPRMQWVPDSGRVLLQHVNRRQNRNQLYYADAASGALTPLLLDEEETHLDDFHDVEWLEDGAAFTFISERGGWRHVYRVSSDGRELIDLTPGAYDVAELLAVDEEGGQLFFTASPDDMAARYLYSVSLDGSGEAKRLTPEAFTGDNRYDIADDGRHALHTHSRLLQPPQYRLVSLPDHEERQMLEDNAALIARLDALERGDAEFFTVSARDELELDGFMLRPPAFEPEKRYPLIIYVYGEVAGQTVRDRWAGDRNLWHLLMTQRDYVVVSIDNRGTPSLKGRDWRKALYGGIGILSSRDQYDGLQDLLARHDFLDPQRVGIWGHSGGGSMTLNMLFRYPEAYAVGVSRAPVSDQRLYDAIYQERYSGLLEEHAEGYEQGSPITHAAGLEGKLLLVHGTGDDNVHYRSSERLINELVRLNKPFDFLAYPNRRHPIRSGEGTELHLYSTMTRYFDEHLGQD
ncbi:MAG: DPP IV N-terminal domain-containing protein [Halieaceae bacterium]|jgi:dipeptidyl-peptidase-4|nr:DPP IV N-terminal domain-containing protein [Halieaceae bacterium]